MKLKLITTKYSIGIYFNTKLIIFGLIPSATEKGSKVPQKGERGPTAPNRSKKEGPQCPTLLVTIYVVFVDL